ncbi:response regulator [Psychromarinibacter sp. C21-152]|uniref:Response regulator n=1 Tax=Psychromarinibacter sediminicola TaxID=3033385 RepID=A0AAE3NQ85_9RHOB|nr:response regulator [Psychromarinibacter sediminicola]MDF0600072.1 response regulator [Psychromarinibacter sediminicola]
MSLREKLKILVVDDMAVSRGLLTQALDQLNIRNYDYVSNGQEAMQYLSRTPVHLVISDYNMPEMDGLGLLRAIRSSAATSKTGFIMVTGSEDARVIQQGAQLGMNNFLKKPFTAANLRECIEKVFGRL